MLLVCPVEGDAPVSLETRNCNMSVTTLKKQTQLCICVHNMISIFTDYKAKNSSMKWGYSQNLVQLHSRLLCAFVTWVIEIPYMIMFLRQCIVKIPIWIRKHYFLKTGLPLILSCSVFIHPAWESRKFLVAPHFSVLNIKNEWQLSYDDEGNTRILFKYFICFKMCYILMFYLCFVYTRQ